MKKGSPIVLLCSLFMLVSFILPKTVHAQAPIKLKVNGNYVVTDVAPIIENDRTYVPVRFIVEALGGTVEYNTESYGSPAVIVYPPFEEDLWLTLFIGHRGALVSESAYLNDVPPIIRNDRTLLPVRFIASYLRCEVAWDQESRTVSLTQVDNNDAFDEYYSEDLSKKISDWLMDPNHTTQEYLNILRGDRNASSASKPIVEPLPVVAQSQPIYNPAPSKKVESYYIGNKNSKVYHRPSCPSVTNMRDSNKVKLTNPSGYKACKVCKP